MKKIVLIAVAVVVALIVMAVIIGATLPKTHTASRSAVIARTPEAVYADVRRRTAAEKEFVIAEEQPPRRLVARVAENRAYGGTWTFELVPEGAGTRVTITENGEIYNPLFRFLTRYVFGYTFTMDKHLDELAAAKE